MTLPYADVDGADADSLSIFRIDVNSPLLVLAAHRGDCDRVELLLNDGVDVNCVNSQGLSACHVAIRFGHADVLAVLLAHRADLALRDARGTLPLRMSLSYQCDRLSCMLLDAGAPLENGLDDYLCRFAATSTAAIRALLNRGVVVNALRQQDSQNTPLHVLAQLPWQRSRLGVVRMLVNDCGLDLYTQNLARDECIDVAIKQCNYNAVRELISAGYSVHRGFFLHESVEASDYELTNILLAAGANVNVRDRDGSTPCHVLRMADGSIGHALIAAGAKLDVANVHGVTARRIVTTRSWVVLEDRLETARRDIAMARFAFVRHRALDVCIGLQSLRLDALQMCEILQRACGRFGRFVAFHHWWAVATLVKHFRSKQ